jgi:hypothetical protein
MKDVHYHMVEENYLLLLVGKFLKRKGEGREKG